MPYCPNCRYEYREGVEKCLDCNMKLVDQLPPKPDAGTIDEEFVPIFSARDNEEAEVVKGVLKDAGIEVIEQAEPSDWRLPGVYGIPGGPEFLTVPASRAEEARRVIDEALKAGENMTEEKE
jgi:hypothetical protein